MQLSKGEHCLHSSSKKKKKPLYSTCCPNNKSIIGFYCCSVWTERCRKLSSLQNPLLKYKTRALDIECEACVLLRPLVWKLHRVPQADEVNLQPDLFNIWKIIKVKWLEIQPSHFQPLQIAFNTTLAIDFKHTDFIFIIRITKHFEKIWEKQNISFHKHVSHWLWVRHEILRRHTKKKRTFESPNHINM